MAIRPAREADIESIIEMCKLSMRATYGAFFDDDQMAPWIEGGETDKFVRGSIGNMLVAEEDGAVVGVAAVESDLIDLVWVALGARGGGLGGELMAAAEAAIREDGHKAARLEVFEPKADAIRFYQRDGWLRGTSFPDPGAGVNKLAMTKPLG